MKNNNGIFKPETVETTYVLQLADMVAVKKVYGLHVGIFVGDQGGRGPCVIHNNREGGVVLSSLAEFAGGQPVRLHKAAQGTGSNRLEIIRRAFSLLGRTYDLLQFNCEHAANLAQTGIAESPQLQGALLLALLGLILAFSMSGD